MFSAIGQWFYPNCRFRSSIENKNESNNSLKIITDWKELKDYGGFNYETQFLNVHKDPGICKIFVEESIIWRRKYQNDVEYLLKWRKNI